MSSQEPLLTVRELAELLGISTRSVHRLLSAGELTAVRVGQRLRFDPSDVRVYLDRHREHTLAGHALNIERRA